MLVNAGFTQVYVGGGGLTAWINAGYPTVTS
jgi:rhodanese-related sulfurtransferase